MSFPNCLCTDCMVAIRMNSSWHWSAVATVEMSKDVLYNTILIREKKFP